LAARTRARERRQREAAGVPNPRASIRPSHPITTARTSTRMVPIRIRAVATIIIRIHIRTSTA
jgi:hypothetical protein